MSGLLLYSKTNGAVDEDVWDDTALIEMYDRAVNITYDAVKKSLKNEEQSPAAVEEKAAVGTVEEVAVQLDGKRSKKKKKSKSKQQKWRVGDRCLARYTNDGVLYEGRIASIDRDAGRAVVEYDGYTTTEEHDIAHIYRFYACGARRRRRRQLAAAATLAMVPVQVQMRLLREQRRHNELQQCSTLHQTTTPTTTVVKRRTFPNKSRSGWVARGGGQLASRVDVASNSDTDTSCCVVSCRRRDRFIHPVPRRKRFRIDDDDDYGGDGIASEQLQSTAAVAHCTFANHDSSTQGETACASALPVLPLPPPPPIFGSATANVSQEGVDETDEQSALSTMLMSWYMSGYHTGYYQAIQDMKNAGNKKSK